MDDYKREIYMEVLRRLQEETHPAFICLNLQSVLFEDRNYSDSADTVLNEFFPEFAALFDGTMWFEDGKCWELRITTEKGWWSDGWYEPRIRALECILRDST